MVSEDTKAIMMLCSQTAISNSNEMTPYTLSEWNKLAQKIAQSIYKRPAGLLAESTKSLQQNLLILPKEADRIAHLLKRKTQLEAELERLSSMGIWILTRADSAYPQQYKKRLREKAPSILFGAGEKALIGQPGVAIVGSRDIDDAGHQFAEIIGQAAAFHGMVVYSGGARGVDITAMKNALDGRGYSVGVLANSLEQAVKKSGYRDALQRGDLALITPYGTKAGFSVGAAMGRNKLIYTLADYAIVVSSDLEKGGTWAGALENLKKQWTPVFVRNSAFVPQGNHALIQKGAYPLEDPIPVPIHNLQTWLDEKAYEWQQNRKVSPQPKQGVLFK